jgi:hypothetical protein
MNDRGNQLQETANAQIFGLIGLISKQGEAALGLPCPGREKLGDGTVASCAMHTADNYHRIATFVDSDRTHHRTETHPHEHGKRKRHLDYTAENIELHALIARLTTGRAALSALAELTDEQLDTVPPASDMKFCDGQRTLEQILTNLLNH